MLRKITKVASTSFEDGIEPSDLNDGFINFYFVSETQDRNA